MSCLWTYEICSKLRSRGDASPAGLFGDLLGPTKKSQKCDKGGTLKMRWDAIIPKNFKFLSKPQNSQKFLQVFGKSDNNAIFDFYQS